MSERCQRMDERCERMAERVAQYTMRLFLNHSAYRRAPGSIHHEFLADKIDDLVDLRRTEHPQSRHESGGPSGVLGRWQRVGIAVRFGYLILVAIRLAQTKANMVDSFFRMIGDDAEHGTSLRDQVRLSASFDLGDGKLNAHPLFRFGWWFRFGRVPW